jgi:integrase
LDLVAGVTFLHLTSAVGAKSRLPHSLCEVAGDKDRAWFRRSTVDASGAAAGGHCHRSDGRSDAKCLRRRVKELERELHRKDKALAETAALLVFANKLGFHVHPHMLRHATGYALANEGTDTRLIHDFLGHASTANTVRYTKFAPGRLAAVRVR